VFAGYAQYGPSSAGNSIGYRCAVVPILRSYAVRRGGQFDPNHAPSGSYDYSGAITTMLTAQSGIGNAVSFRCAIVPTLFEASYAVIRGGYHVEVLNNPGFPWSGGTNSGLFNASFYLPPSTITSGSIAGLRCTYQP